MLKPITLLVAGAICGAAAVYAFVGGERDAAWQDASQQQRPENFAPGSDLAEHETPREAVTVDASSRLAAYRNAAHLSDFATLAGALQRAVSAPPSLARDIEIDALLSRMAELDPARAVQLARTLVLAHELVAGAFVAWAEADPEAALDALGGIDVPAARRSVALALLVVFGDDMRGFERIAAALPQDERPAFQVDWLAHRAEYDPYGAFRETMALPNMTIRQRATEQVAAAWARQDPEAAMSLATALPEELQMGFRNGVGSEWARLDAAGFLAYLQYGGISVPVSGGIGWLVANDPESVLQAAEHIPDPLGPSLRRSAASALAQTDPLTVIARADALPPGAERDMMLEAIASGYARQDPEAALAWAARLTSPPPAVHRNVALAIAEHDLDRALDLLTAGAGGIGQDFMATLSFSSLVSQALSSGDDERAVKIADRLLAMEEGTSATPLVSILPNVVGTWLQQDADGALDWISANAADVSTGFVGNMARSLANVVGVATAMEYADRLPRELRPTWMGYAAGAHARHDPAAAYEWIAPLRGQAGYDAALREVVMGAAQTDPAAAAGMLAGASRDVELATAGMVASSWAAVDPQAAARWAQSLDNDDAAAAAAAGLVTNWAASDPQAARRWTLDQPRGDVRDEALSGLLLRGAMTGIGRGVNADVDERLLDAFSSDVAREQGVGRLIPLIARNDPEQARGLLEQYVTSPLLRQRLEAQIGNVGN